MESARRLVKSQPFSALGQTCICEGLSRIRRYSPSRIRGAPRLRALGAQKVAPLASPQPLIRPLKSVSRADPLQVSSGPPLVASPVSNDGGQLSRQHAFKRAEELLETPAWTARWQVRRRQPAPHPRVARHVASASRVRLAHERDPAPLPLILARPRPAPPHPPAHPRAAISRAPRRCVPSSPSSLPTISSESSTLSSCSPPRPPRPASCTSASTSFVMFPLINHC